MDSLKPLTDFYSAIEKDFRIGPAHIALYAALLCFRAARGFPNPIEIFRAELSHAAKISSKECYHKCLRELHEYGYLRYEPSFKKTRGSRIYFFDFELRNLIKQ